MVCTQHHLHVHLPPSSPNQKNTRTHRLGPPAQRGEGAIAGPRAAPPLRHCRGPPRRRLPRGLLGGGAMGSAWDGEDRFTLLLLAEGEYYFRDYSCHWWKAADQRSALLGRLSALPHTATAAMAAPRVAEAPCPPCAGWRGT